MIGYAETGLTLLVGQQEGHLAWWRAGMVICLERGVDLHMAQLMPLLLTVSCFSKIQIGFTSLVPAHLGSPDKGSLNVSCVCVCVVVLVCVDCVLSNSVGRGQQEWACDHRGDSARWTHCIPRRRSRLHWTQLHGTRVCSVLCRGVPSCVWPTRTVVVGVAGKLTQTQF